MTAQRIAEFDAAIAQVERLLRLARECGFVDTASEIENDIVTAFLPDLERMLAVAEGAAHAALMKRHQRLTALLR